MHAFHRIRAVAIVVGAAATLGLLVPAAASAAPLSSAALRSVEAQDVPVVSIEGYCGGTGTIKDPTRGYTLFTMIYTGSTFHEGYWIRDYDARYLGGQYFKSTGNRC